MVCKCKEDDEKVESRTLSDLIDSWVKEGTEHDDKHSEELRKILGDNPIQFRDFVE